MYASPFDEFTKTLETGVPRRTILKALASAIASGVVAVPLASGVWAAPHGIPGPPPHHCYTSDDCPADQVCLSRLFEQCGIVPDCNAQGMILCGCHCVDPSGETPCEADEDFTAGGCCAAKPCAHNHDCGVKHDKCIGGFCIPRGVCIFPPF